MAHLSTAQAAARLGVSTRRVVALINEGRLRATRISGVWAIREADLARYRPLPKHRPRKTIP